MFLDAMSLAPNSWRILVSLFVISAKLGIEFEMLEITNIYMIKKMICMKAKCIYLLVLVMASY